MQLASARLTLAGGGKLITEGSQHGHRSLLQSCDFSTPSTSQAEEINTQYIGIRLDLNKDWQPEQESTEEVKVPEKGYLICPPNKLFECIFTSQFSTWEGVPPGFLHPPNLLSPTQGLLPTQPPQHKAKFKIKPP